VRRKEIAESAVKSLSAKCEKNTKIESTMKRKQLRRREQ
jgi:hypothetical protein